MSTGAHPRLDTDHRKSHPIKGHHAWLAAERPTLADARAFETRLLGVHLPYLNRRRAA